MKSAALSALIIFFFAASMAVSAAAQQVFISNLSGRQMVPAVTSDRSFVIRATVEVSPQNPERIDVELNAVAGSEFPAGSTVSIHRAAVGENAPAIFDLPLPAGHGWGMAASISGADISEFYSNGFYFSIKTPEHPEGEVRGQLKLANGTYNDYDGDGRTDLQVYRSSEHTFYAERSTDGTWVVQPLGQAGDSVSLTVDWDGDGISDFSTARYNAEALWRIIPSSTGVLEETLWGSSTLGDFFAAADYDGDGRFDIAVFRAGTWYIIESSTGNYRYEFWGQAGDIPAANDFDGDGKADLTVARSEGGVRNWYTRLSTTGEMRVVPFGLSSDGFFTGHADFDGDGKQDITVVRNEDGGRRFYTLRSSDSQMQAVLWGLPFDVVKLGDYDGDGRTDHAVTRADNGRRVFYILESSTGEVRAEYFGLAGDF